VRVDGPAEVHFLFEQPEKRLGVQWVPPGNARPPSCHRTARPEAWCRNRVAQAILPDSLPREIIWIAEPGAGGGGGGGGNKQQEPARKAELPGEKEISVPAIKPMPAETPKAEDPPPTQVDIPAKTLGADQLVLPGSWNRTQKVRHKVSARVAAADPARARALAMARAPGLVRVRRRHRRRRVSSGQRRDAA
jgi:hypothetical protein